MHARYVNLVARERDEWEPYDGKFRLTWPQALAEFSARAADQGPAPMVIVA